MYDLSDAVVKPNFNGLSSKTRLGGYGEEFGDLADLGASEVSLDLQAFVNDPHFSDGIFTDIVEGKGLGAAAAAMAAAGQVGRGLPPASCAGLTYPTPGYLQQPMPYTVPRLGIDTTAQIPVKKDPEAAEFQACRQPPMHPGFTGGYNPAYASLTPVSSGGGLLPGRLPSGAPQPLSSRSSGGSKHSPSKRVSPGSEEYRRRRERNNVAVRKSREKAKMRGRETEERVKFLSRENEGLHKRVEMMTKELTVLKNLFANVGVLPEQLQREIAKQMGDGFAGRPAPPAGL